MEMEEKISVLFVWNEMEEKKCEEGKEE